MTFGTDRVIGCPACRALFVRNTVDSVNSFGARRWSDGFTLAPMWPTPPVIQWCVFCGRWFWLEEAPVLVELPASVGSGRLPSISVSDDVPEHGYASALAQEWTGEQEAELRIRLWWWQNAQVRAGKEAEDPAGRHRNMERLATLLTDDDRPVLLAEVHRELGQFTSCLNLLDRLDGRTVDTAAIRWAETIAAAARRGEAAPVRLGWDALLESQSPSPEVTCPGDGSRTVSLTASDGARLPDCISEGFYPLPVTEDVLAFVNQRTEQACTPVLSVQLSLIQDDWHGWATFFDEGAEYLVREGRLFTDEQWDAYQRFDPEYQADLRWYWSQESWQTAASDAKRDRYFRIQYQLFYGSLEPPSPEEVRHARKRFEPEWEELRTALRSADGEMAEWLDENRSRVYWDLFWARFWGANTGSLHTPEQFRDAVTRDMEDTQRRERRREVGMPRLRFVELGGEPRWFVHREALARRDDAYRLRFVGQLWTDVLDVYPIQLLHLFFDPETGRMVQFAHDFD